MAYCLNSVCPQPQNRADAKFCLSCGSPLTLAKKYQPESLLGKGGFGRTLLARIVSDKDASSETRCVIKQIYGAPAETNDVFKAEARRLEQLGKHPQIPRLLDSIENSLGQFLVQEFAPGKTLEALVIRDGAWGEEKVRSLLTSLTAVLQYVHSFKVIHRDIKPANIIQGDRQAAPMLVDFGAAKWIGKTVAKTVIGSAGYAAPEQSMGQATFASDIYSLGLTCLHLLTGLHPFELYSAAEDCWVWQDYLSGPISGQFAQVLDRMVARSLQDRYATMDEVSAAVKTSSRFSFGTVLPKQFNGARQLLERAKTSVSSSRTQPEKSLAPVVFNLQPWKLRRRIMVPMGLTQAITISSSAPIFATAGTDKVIRLWDLVDGRLLHAFTRKRFDKEGHSAAVTDVQFHPDGRALYSASDDGTIKEWDAWEYELMNTLSGAGWMPTALTVSPDGKILLSANSDGQIVLWDIASLEVVGQLAQHQNRVNAVVISQLGDLLASAGEDNTVRLWQYRSGQTPQMSKVLQFKSTLSTLGFGGLADERRGVVGVAFQASTDSGQSRAYLIVATSDTVWRYELTPQCELREGTVFCRSENAIRAIALSKNGILAVGTEDRTLRLWDLSLAECVAELKHDWGVSAITFSPSGEMLITASADETLFIWQKENS